MTVAKCVVYSAVALLPSKFHYAQEASKRLAIHAWQTAWDCYALAAAVLDQMEFESAMAHKAIICEIVSGAEAEGRRWLLAVLYDELARFASRVILRRWLAFFSPQERMGGPRW